MSLVPDPLIEKRQNEADKLSRRRQTATEVSKQIIVRREAFFDRLALMNAGALTFSITLRGSVVVGSMHARWALYLAWILLLFAVGASLLRNLAHHYQMADAMTNMAESEIAYIDVDQEIIQTRSVVYSDSSEDFDVEREMSVNLSTRETWERTLTDQQKTASRHWAVLISAEWTAGVSMLLGFVCLIFFATRNL